MGWTVYILRCGDGTLYTGCTNNLPRRLAAHQSGKGAKYTRSRRPVALAYREEVPDRSAALRREAAIKRLDRREKLALAGERETVEIRPLRGADSRLEVSRIYEESWKFAYQGIVPQSYLDGIPAGLWAQSLDLRDSLILTENGAPAGTASVCPSRWPDWPGFGEIVSLYLLPERMGRGYGGLLLEAAVETLAEQGFRDVLLWVLEENRRARRFYEKHGFCPAGDFMEQELGGTLLREVLYCRHMD